MNTLYDVLEKDSYADDVINFVYDEILNPSQAVLNRNGCKDFSIDEHDMITVWKKKMFSLEDVEPLLARAYHNIGYGPVIDILQDVILAYAKHHGIIY